MHGPRATEPPIWYFAYGANMSPRVLARRGLAPIASEPGRLDGYRLCFSHRGLVPTEPAFANIEPAPPDISVHGVLHRLAAVDMARLDRLEGAEYLHIEVAVLGSRSGRVSARAYRDPHPVRGRRPSRRYLADLCEGARYFGLPDDYVRALAAQPSLHVPVLSDVTTFLVRAAEGARRAGVRPERVRLFLRGREGRRDPRP